MAAIVMANLGGGEGGWGGGGGGEEAIAFVEPWTGKRVSFMCPCLTLRLQKEGN